MQTLKQNRFIIITGIMLLLAIPSIWPYSYYQLLRWVVTIVACYNAYIAHNAKQGNWMVIMIGIAILFNPIAPIHFEKSTWVILDFITACTFLFYIINLKTNKI